MPELALPFFARSAWARRLLVPLIFLAALALFLFRTFPYDALSERITAEARAAGYDISIGELGHAGVLGIRGGDVRLKTLSADVNSAPTEYKLDQLTLKPELLGILLRKPAVGFNVDAYGGNAHGVARMSTDPKTPGLSSLQVTADSIDLKQLPPALVAGVEVLGLLGVQADLSSLQALESSSGTVAFTLKGAALVKGNAMGIPLPKTLLGDLTGSLTVDKGVGKLEKVQLRGGDLDAEVEGTIRMKPLLSLSQADLKVHLKPKESWLEQNPLVKGSMGFLGPKAPDGGYSFTLSGPLSRLTPRPGR